MCRLQPEISIDIINKISASNWASATKTGLSILITGLRIFANINIYFAIHFRFCMVWSLMVLSRSHGKTDKTAIEIVVGIIWSRIAHGRTIND